MSYSVNVNGDSYGSFKLVEASGKDVRFLRIFLLSLLMNFLLDYRMLWTMQHSLVFIWAQVAPNSFDPFFADDLIICAEADLQ